ncbi:SRPBCC family protein [Flavobacterium sp. Root420]|uniref:SRPBCC family protein n=1 Tax=Flavobacterium sp. Root420 TaxID=1736533 RepID=UPI0006FE8BF2|nr:SRPBCC family protein [Flavobacterium sp. Root420]KQX00606.1 ATPase [Flavobacterium sp. Root420]
MATVTFPSTPDCEIVSSRVVNFSQELVFKAWTDPNHLKNWWGPKGFTNTFEEFDLRPGGRWKFVMHAPDKGNFQNECEFVKIEKPSEIAWIRISKPLFNIVATFEKIADDQTKIVFRMVFDTPEECAKLRPYVVDKNEENFDRLENELSKMTL